MSGVFFWLGVALAGYAFLVALLFLLQRSLLFLPNREKPDLAAAGLAGVMRAVTLQTADGLQTMSWYRPPAPGAPVLVYLHGNGGHIGYRAWKIAPYHSAGLGVLLVGYRGYGGNPGTPSEAGFYADGRAALDFLAAEGIGPQRIVLYGESLGAAVAVQMAAERGAAAMILEAPPSSIVAVAGKHYWYVPVRWLMRDRFDSLPKIAGLRIPLLVLHGERDTIVPLAFGRALFDAAVGPKEMRTFPQGGHNDLYDHGAAEAVLDFLRRKGLAAATP